MTYKGSDPSIRPLIARSIAYSPVRSSLICWILRMKLVGVVAAPGGLPETRTWISASRGGITVLPSASEKVMRTFFFPSSILSQRIFAATTQFW